MEAESGEMHSMVSKSLELISVEDSISEARSSRGNDNMKIVHIGMLIFWMAGMNARMRVLRLISRVICARSGFRLWNYIAVTYLRKRSFCSSTWDYS